MTAAAADIGERVLSAAKPDFYFSRKKWASAASLPLTLPPCLRAPEGDERARAMIADGAPTGAERPNAFAEAIAPTDHRTDPTLAANARASFESRARERANRSRDRRGRRGSRRCTRS